MKFYSCIDPHGLGTQKAIKPTNHSFKVGLGQFWSGSWLLPPHNNTLLSWRRMNMMPLSRAWLDQTYHNVVYMPVSVTYINKIWNYQHKMASQVKYDSRLIILRFSDYNYSEGAGRVNIFLRWWKGLNPIPFPHQPAGYVPYEDDKWWSYGT